MGQLCIESFKKPYCGHSPLEQGYQSNTNRNRIFREDEPTIYSKVRLTIYVLRRVRRNLTFNTRYRLWQMVGKGGDGEYFCQLLSRK
jgi:hypothetical protein